MKLALAAIILALGTASCAFDDVGTCCMAPDPTIIPEPQTNPATGEPLTTLVHNVDLNCESAYCGSYRGSAAFCTRPCANASQCPSGYSCAPMLETDATQTFCVQQLNACEK